MHGVGWEVVIALEDDWVVAVCEDDVVEENSDHGGKERGTDRLMS